MKTFFEFLANENLVLKKRPVEDGKFQFVVDSDLLDKRSAGTETYKNKEKIRALGFTWDKNLQKWVSPETYTPVEFSAIMPELRKKLLSLNAGFDEKTVGELAEDLEEYLELGLIDKLKVTFEELKQKIIDQQNSPEIRDFLRFSSKFTKRSFNNKILIWIQNKNATHVEGKETWRREFGRKIKKGAKAIKIWVPYQKKDKRSEDDAPQVDQNVDETKQLTRFRIGHVFDISDTEPIPGKEKMYVQEPKWFDESTPDETTRYIYDALLDFAKENKIEVEISDEGLDGARGVSRKGSIQLVQENIPLIVHELAHEVLHNAERRKKYGEQRDRFEFEADGVSFLFCSHFGLPNKHAENYLAMWLEGDKEGKKKVDAFFEMINENKEVIETSAMFVKYVNQKAMEAKSIDNEQSTSGQTQ